MYCGETAMFVRDLSSYRSHDNDKSLRIRCRLEIFCVVAIAVVVSFMVAVAAVVPEEDTLCVVAGGGGGGV